MNVKRASLLALASKQAGFRANKIIKYLLISVYFLGTIYGCVLQSIVYTNMPLNPLSLLVAHPKLTNES